jgi:hypothetical protein
MAAITYPLVLNIATLVRQILPMNQKAFLSTNKKKQQSMKLEVIRFIVATVVYLNYLYIIFRHDEEEKTKRKKIKENQICSH